MKRQRRKKSLTKRLERNTIDTLERDTRKLVNKANARLSSLQRRFKSGTWASKKLMHKLSSQPIRSWSKGRIRIKMNASRTQLLAIHKAVTNFLNSETSTRKGIENVRKRQINKNPNVVITKIYLYMGRDSFTMLIFDNLDNRILKILKKVTKIS